MIERRLAFVLLALPFVWVTWAVLPAFPGGFPGGQIPVVIAAAIVLAVAVVALDPRIGFAWPLLVVLAGLVVIAAAASAATARFGALGPELAAGVLVGLPWILVSYVARPRAPLVHRFAAYGLAVTWGLLLLAAAQPLLNAPDASGFVTGFFTVVTDQGQVFGGLLTGSATPPLPVHDLFDPAYAALTGLSVLGLLLVTVRPQTGKQIPLPVAVHAYRETGADREMTTPYGFSAAQQTVFRERSTTEPPFVTWPPGLVPVFFGAAAAGAFLVAAYYLPTWAVLATTVGLVAAVVALLLLVERPHLVGDLRPPPASSAPRPPAPSGAAEVRQVRM